MDLPQAICGLRCPDQGIKKNPQYRLRVFECAYWRLNHQRLRGGGKSVHTPNSARFCKPADRLAQGRVRVDGLADVGAVAAHFDGQRDFAASSFTCRPRACRQSLDSKKPHNRLRGF
ncbi:hypothetical protein ACPJXG_05245 [Janthinobacterium sp. NFX145]|uniref:Uncharacterized protein n=1 Tax=Janthinobacterium rivuli TaxID=2751478 RepID=A0ABY8I1R6_9BURK|nr:hypothetical protein [Janthinobacterium rivuli]WFR78836.1 hypothetical protein P9875_24550 [Janthinobacterium rivuli]